MDNKSECDDYFVGKKSYDLTTEKKKTKCKKLLQRQVKSLSPMTIALVLLKYLLT